MVFGLGEPEGAAVNFFEVGRFRSEASAELDNVFGLFLDGVAGVSIGTAVGNG